ncbi:MAG: hypothetical protein M1818_008188 [Claussenomyces sp. TS43310]|nr:MAG: hypothetical protein M1818_008188 [Claussenomyces sp. TS43310]
MAVHRSSRKAQALEKTSENLDTTSSDAPFVFLSQPLALVELGGVYANGRFLVPRRIDPPKAISEREHQFLTKPHLLRCPESPWVRASFYRPADLQGPNFLVDDDGNYTCILRHPRTGKEEEQCILPTVSLPSWDSRQSRSQNGGAQDLWLVSMNRDEVPSYCYWHTYADEVAFPPPDQQDATRANEIDALHKVQTRKHLQQLHREGNRQIHRLPHLSPMGDQGPNGHGDRELWKKSWNLFSDALANLRNAKEDNMTLGDIISNHFFEEQSLLLIPAIEDDHRFGIQQENAERYTAALNSPRFTGVPNNLVTKLTMLHFGLPIEPLTMNNVMNAGKDANMADEMDPVLDVDAGRQRVQKIMYAEKPLEFLDTYHERHFGFPGLRIKKADPKAKVLPRKSPIVSKHGNEIPYDHMCGTNRHRMRHMKSLAGTQGLEQVMSLRGGAGEPDIVRIHIWSAIGVLNAENNYSNFYDVALRSLDMTTIPLGRTQRWTYSIDLLDCDGSPTIAFLEHRKIIPDKAYTVTKDTFTKEWYEKNLKQRLSDGWHIRVRLNNVASDSFWCAESRDSIQLYNKKYGAVYWRPIRTRRKHVGINQLQIGFREVIGRLLPNYGNFDVRWKTQSRIRGSGVLRLGAVAPDMVLYEAALKLRSEDKVEKLARISFTILDTPEAIEGPEINRTDDAKIIIPGCNAKTTDGRMPQVPFIDEARDVTNNTLAVVRGSLTRLNVDPDQLKPNYRIYGEWGHYAYSKDNGHEITSEFDQAGDYEAIFYAVLIGCPNIVARLSFASHILVYPDREDHSDHTDWNDDSRSLSSFRAALTSSMKRRFPTGNEAFVIFLNWKGDYSGDRVIVTSTTTEEEWRLYVYSWIRSKYIYLILADEDDYVDNLPAQPSPGYESAEIPPENNPTTAQGSVAHPPAPLAGEPKTDMSWREWQQERFQQEDLRYSAYTDLHSLYSGKKGPKIPQYGQTLENPISGGEFMPTTYQPSMTVAQISDLKRHARMMENSVLERLVVCPICDMNLMPGSHHNDEAVAHFTEHQNRLKTAGKCPACNTDEWGTWTNTQKIDHFKIHGGRNQNAGSQGIVSTVRTSNRPESEWIAACNADRELMSAVRAAGNSLRDMITSSEKGSVAAESWAVACRAIIELLDAAQAAGESTVKVMTPSTQGRSIPKNDWAAAYGTIDELVGRMHTEGRTTVKPNVQNRPVAVNDWAAAYEVINELVAEIQPAGSGLAASNLTNDAGTCQWPRCKTSFANRSHFEIADHYGMHRASFTCPYDGCNDNLGELSPQAFAQHMEQRHARAGARLYCPFCDIGDLADLSHKDQVVHLQEHINTLCPFRGCLHEYEADDYANRSAFLEHFDEHFQRETPTDSGGSGVGSDDNNGENGNQDGDEDEQSEKSSPNSEDTEFGDQDSDEYEQGEESTPTREDTESSSGASLIEKITDEMNARVQQDSGKGYEKRGWYCPGCLKNVNKEPLKIHRGNPCNVKDDDSWIFGNQREIRARASARRQDAKRPRDVDKDQGGSSVKRPKRK